MCYGGAEGLVMCIHKEGQLQGPVSFDAGLVSKCNWMKMILIILIWQLLFS